MEKRKFARSFSDLESTSDQDIYLQQDEKDKSYWYSNKNGWIIVCILTFTTCMITWLHYNTTLSNEILVNLERGELNIHQAITHTINSESVGIFSHHHINAIPMTEFVQPITKPILLPTNSPVIMKQQSLNMRNASQIVDSQSIVTKEMVESQISKIRNMKFNQRVVMETDANAKKEINILQTLLREYLKSIYGPEPYHMEMQLKFPLSMIKSPEDHKEESIVIELAPLEFVPYSVYYILNLAENWKGGAFHRNAGHVLQALVNTRQDSLAFQEYHPNFPHVKYTLGYAGGPAFYISTVDNTRNHGPASQGSKTEADSCFGKIIDGFDVVKRMQKQPGAGSSGFINKDDNYIRIPSFKLLRK